LHFRLNQFRAAGSIKNFITAIINTENFQTTDPINSAIELAFDIQRHWINYQFPRYLMSLGDIANDIFRKNDLPLCDYSFFASLVECYFMSPYVIPMDEYGLPIQISKKIGDMIKISSNMDDALEQLHNFIPSQDSFSNIEIEFIEEFKNEFPEVSVVRFDERFTSKIASYFISQSGKNKKQRQEKGLIDKVSATLILQQYLEQKL